MALDFAAGCLGGCAGVLVGHPFDTVKVRIQTQDFRNPQYKGTLNCFASILKKESVSGLYKGMSSPMAGVAVVNAIVFGVYGNLQRHLPHPDAPSSHLVAGAAAGFVQSFVCGPMELVKTRLQIRQGQGCSGPLQCIREILRTQGLRGLNKGLGTTILREVPGFGTYFYSYELMTRSSGNSPISTGHMLLAGGLSGTFSWVITYPIDVIKSRLQADVAGKYSGFVDCLKRSIHSEGYAVLTRGLTSTIMRAFPTNAATFTVVTWVIRWANMQEQESQAYILPELVEVPPYEVKPIQRRPVEVFGLKEQNLFHWRKAVMHDYMASNAFSSFQFVPRTSQVIARAKDYTVVEEEQEAETQSKEEAQCEKQTNPQEQYSPSIR